MGFLSRLFGKQESAGPDAKTQAMAGMMASNNEGMFLTGLQAATELADQGDKRGLLAIRMAIVARSGQQSARFYEPGAVAGPAPQLAARYANAQESILDLARNKALLSDVCASGEFLSAALVAMGGSHSELEALAYAVHDAGGPEQALAFQLLYNEQRSAIALRGKS